MGVPNRWLEYTRFNLPVDRILPIKTPLKSAFNTGLSRPDMEKRGLDNQLAIDEEFTPQQFIADTKKKGLSVGIVIDLTYTRRYYNPQEFFQQGIRHHKIFCEGHVIPSEEVYKEFAGVLNDYLKENSCEGQVAAVHCTHGINRTGYLVCRYLIEQLGWNPEKAITEFGSARGHAIERENYLDHLRKGCPPLPASSPRKSSGSSRQHSPYRHERKSWRERSGRRDYRDGTEPDQRRRDVRQTRFCDSDWRAHDSQQQHSRSSRDAYSRTPTGMESWAPRVGSWAPHTSARSWAPDATGSWSHHNGGSSSSSRQSIPRHQSRYTTDHDNTACQR